MAVYHLVARLAVGLALLAGPANAQSRPPVAPVETVRDVRFGIAADDPYRWLEKLDDARVRSYLEAQDRYARATLARLPGRERLRERLRELGDSTVSVTDLRRAAGKLFYFKTAPGDDLAKLYARDARGGPERLLVDPIALGAAGSHTSLVFQEPSPDGAFVAVGTTEGGSGDTALRIVDAATGEVVDRSIDRLEWFFYSVVWTPGSRSLLYARAPLASGPGAGLRVFEHAVGTRRALDRAVFGYGLAPGVRADAVDIPAVLVTQDSAWAVGLVSHEIQNEFDVYVAPAGRLSSGRAPWRRIAGPSDGAAGVALVGDALYVLTHRGAPRFRVARVDLARGSSLAGAATVVPESTAVVVAIAAATDALYVQDLDGGLAGLRRLPYGGRIEHVELPFAGDVAEMVADRAAPGVALALQSWTEAPRYFAFDPEVGRASDMGLVPPSRADFSGVESREVTVRSDDGTLVPLTVVAQRGLALDGSHPTMLQAYGAFGISLTPAFSPRLLAWLERGGVLAVAHVRGGGEYGDAWHRAGTTVHRRRTIEDFLACAGYLVDRRYTTPAKLAASGWSAGGMVVGMAVDEHPERFGAAIVHAGLFNPVRMEATRYGSGYASEYGDPATRAGFRALRDMDAYLNVRPGTAYPAVLLDSGINDVEVPSWEVAKMAARLQASSTSGRPVLLEMDFAAGHGLGVPKSRRDERLADAYAFLLWQFGDPEFQPAPDR